MAHLLHSPLALLIVQLVVIIAASRLLGLLARGAHQPLVVAEIVAGILLGPSFLGALAPELARSLFPPASLGGLGLLSQLGLILFMFLIGLELDLRLLRGRGHASVVISHTSIIIPFACGAALAAYIRPALSDPSVAATTFTVFLAAAMSITAFPVLARILIERRLLRTKIGAIAITCAAVDDVTVWCILAFAVSIARSTQLSDAAWTTGLAVVYTLLMVFVARPFLRRLAARGSEREGLTQDAVAMTFVLLFVSSWATEQIGVHALFGAFLLGAITPRHGGFARALAEKLEDLVVIVLLPVFFALSGLRTEIGLLNTPEAWLYCALIVVVACLSKIGGSFIAARATGLGWREASAVGVLMNTRGMMVLIVLNIGLDLGVISPALFTMMVLMALFTTFITAPLLQAIYPPDELARELRDDPPEPPARGAAGYGVMACVAYDSADPGMILLARALLGAAPDGGRLYGLHLLRPAERTSTILDQEGDLPNNALDPLLEAGRQHGLEVRPLSFVSSEPARDICGVADVKGVDLVLLGGHEPLFGQALLGGTVHAVMKEAAADVGVLVNRGLHELRAVLVPFQGTAHDRAALELGLRMARCGARLRVLRITPAADPAGADDLLRGAAEQGALLDTLPTGVDPAEGIMRAASADIDLLILGVKAEWGQSQRATTQVPERMLLRCAASVLIVRRQTRAPALAPTAPAV